MLEAILSNGMNVFLDISLNLFLRAQERNRWLDAITTDETGKKIKIKINSIQVAAVRDILNDETNVLSNGMNVKV